jgi:hypothetical protein
VYSTALSELPTVFASSQRSHPIPFVLSCLHHGLPIGLTCLKPLLMPGPLCIMGRLVSFPTLRWLLAVPQKYMRANIRGTSAMPASESSQDSKGTWETCILTGSFARVVTSSGRCQDTITYSKNTSKAHTLKLIRRSDALNSDPFFLSFQVDSFVSQHRHRRTRHHGYSSHQAIPTLRKTPSMAY